MVWKAGESTKLLRAALDSYDDDEAAQLCQVLIAHVRGTDEVFPEKEAKRVLGMLRKKRCFGLVQRVADALLQSGQETPLVRRQYAQSQLDQGNITAGIRILEELAADDDVRGEEADEARGLLGRAYKQLYVDSAGSSTRGRAQQLSSAIGFYEAVYRADRERLWHGVNAAALLARASRDGIAIDGHADPGASARTIALAVREAVESRDLDEKADTWDFASAAEASVALDDSSGAADWFARYVESEYSDAFEIASSLRQLEEVWGLAEDAEPGSRILPVLRASLLKAEGGSVELSPESIRPDRLQQSAEDFQYEKVLGDDSYLAFRWYAQGLERAGAIARINNEYEEGVGTGFLVRAEDLHPDWGDGTLLVTNNHVVSTREGERQALPPEKAVVEFEARERQQFKIAEVLWESPKTELDCTIVRLDREPPEAQAYPIARALPVVGANERIYVIGHPKGRTLSFSLHDNLLLAHESPFVHYRTPTEGGSSGSPVFNSDWDLIALHHAGGHRMPMLDGSGRTYAANEGIWFRAILDAIRAN